MQFAAYLITLFLLLLLSKNLGLAHQGVLVLAIVVVVFELFCLVSAIFSEKLIIVLAYEV